MHTCQLSQIRHQSRALPYGSPYLPHKIIFWAFLCLSLWFSPFSSKLEFLLFAVRFQGHFCMYLVTDIKTMIVNLDSMWWICRGGGGGPLISLRVVKKRKSSDFSSPEVGISEDYYKRKCFPWKCRFLDPSCSNVGYRYPTFEQTGADKFYPFCQPTKSYNVK